MGSAVWKAERNGEQSHSNNTLWRHTAEQKTAQGALDFSPRIAKEKGQFAGFLPCHTSSAVPDPTIK
jgi:hypothetical protein